MSLVTLRRVIGIPTGIAGWLVLCFALPSPWVAEPATGLVGLLLVARDVAAALGLHRLVPRRRQAAGTPLPRSARRFACMRLGAAAIAVTIWAVTRLPWVVAVSTAAYAASCTVTRLHFPDLHGGPSYIRVVFKLTIAQAVGRRRAFAVEQRLRPLVWGLTLIAGFACLAPAQEHLEIHNVVSAIGLGTVVPASGRGGSAQMRKGAGDLPDVAHPASTQGQTSHGTADEGVPQGQTRASLCGSDHLGGLPPMASVYRSRLEVTWKHLGAVVAGCSAVKVDTTAADGVIVWLSAGGALVTTSDDTAATYVSGARLTLLRRVIDDRSLVRVEALQTTTAVAYQLFVLDRGCEMSFETFGDGVVELEPASTAAVIDVMWRLGAKPTSLRATRSGTSKEIHLVLDVSAGRVEVDLVADGAVTIVNGPNVVRGLTYADGTRCSLQEARELAAH